MCPVECIIVYEDGVAIWSSYYIVKLFCWM
jgi:hypothetical protein